MQSDRNEFIEIAYTHFQRSTGILRGYGKKFAVCGNKKIYIVYITQCKIYYCIYYDYNIYNNIVILYILQYYCNIVYVGSHEIIHDFINYIYC